jgi:hypothetical protein
MPVRSMLVVATKVGDAALLKASVAPTEIHPPFKEARTPAALTDRRFCALGSRMRSASRTPPAVEEAMLLVLVAHPIVVSLDCTVRGG